MGRMMCFIFFSLIILGHSYDVAASSYVPSAAVLGDSVSQFEMSGDYFFSTKRKDVLGDVLLFNEGESFERVQAQLTGRYGYGERLELYSVVRWRFNRSLAALTGEEAGETLEVTIKGEESFLLGFKYAFLLGKKLQSSLDFGLRQTFYTNEEYPPPLTPPNDQLVLGDSGDEWTLGLRMAIPLTPGLYLGGSVAYVSPPNPLSPEVEYALESARAWQNWSFLIGFKGIASLGKSPYSDDPESRPVLSQGSTHLFNSVNRQYISPYVGLNVLLFNMRLEFKVSQRMAGISTDEGIEMLGTLVWNSRGVATSQRRVYEYKEYYVEATVIKVSPQKKLLKIDKGLGQEVEKGMSLDVYKTDFFGGNILVASGKVLEVGGDWAIVKLVKRYRPIKIKPGFTVRGP